jgi:hypothetical protein
MAIQIDSRIGYVGRIGEMILWHEKIYIGVIETYKFRD